MLDMLSVDINSLRTIDRVESPCISQYNVLGRLMNGIVKPVFLFKCIVFVQAFAGKTKYGLHLLRKSPLTNLRLHYHEKQKRAKTVIMSCISFEEEIALNLEL